MEKCIIISQAEALVLIPLLKHSVDTLEKKYLLTSFQIETISSLRSSYLSIIAKLKEAFNA